MGLFDRLFAKDPTAGWPPFAGRTPAFDLEMLAFGPLRLGAPLESARAIGRPSRLRRPVESSTTLEYDAGGFRLEFFEGKLACVSFVTATEAGERLRDAAAAGEPSIGGLRVSDKTTPDEVRAWFGEPTSDSGGGERLRWLEYQRPGATLEFEFDGEKGLGYVQIYVDGYA